LSTDWVPNQDDIDLNIKTLCELLNSLLLVLYENS